MLDLGIRRRFIEVVEASGRDKKGLSKDAGLGETYVRDVVERERGTEAGIKKVLRGLSADLIPYVIDGIGVAPDDWQDFFRKHEPVRGADGVFNHSLAVVGRIGAGAEIQPDFEQVSPDGLFEISIPFPVSKDAIAFEVDGESMWPRYDPGDVIICGREGTDVDQVIGWEAAVRTTDGKRYLKRIRRGSEKGLFDLESHNASPIRDVALDWVAEIDHVVRAGRWRRLDRAAQQKLIMRAKAGPKNK